jgi:hypothetical protein
MADKLTIDVDTRALVAAMDRLGASAIQHTKRAAKATADRIVVEARARVRRRTGVTAASIHAEETRNGDGWVVLPWDEGFARSLAESGNNDRVNFSLPGWIEFGTDHMPARPYFFAAARMEEGTHDRRMRQAIVDAIEEVGLGD